MLFVYIGRTHLSITATTTVVGGCGATVSYSCTCQLVLVVAVVAVRRHFYALRLCKLEDATSDENFVVVAVVSQQLCAWAGVLDRRAALQPSRWSAPNPIQDFMHYAMGVSARFPASRSFPFSFLPLPLPLLLLLLLLFPAAVLHAARSFC